MVVASRVSGAGVGSRHAEALHGPRSRGARHATPKLVAMSPSRPRWGWPPAQPLLGTILDFARAESNPADLSEVVPLVIRSDTRQPRLASARGAHRSALGGAELTRLDY